MIRVIQPDGTEQCFDESKPPLERLQELVGGYIEPVPAVMHNLTTRIVLVDEDGMSKGLPPNLPGTLAIGCSQMLFGPIVIVEKGDLR